MMRSAMRALLPALGLVTFLSLPAAAAEKPAVSCPAPIQAPATAAAASLAKIFGTAPAPKQASGTVDCDQCPGGTSGPEFQCTRQCRSHGLCSDQCYADASTCQLVTCICLLC